MSRKIRVMIVDDHGMVRQGLSTFLSLHDDLEIIGVASSGQETINTYAEIDPDIILMDLIMPDMNGVDVIRHISKEDNNVNIMALSSFSDKELVRAALEAGAKGYMLKDISGDQLAEAIRKIMSGEPVLADSATRALIETVARGSKMSPFELSTREREVLIYIVDGLSNAGIAYKMGVKQSTVKTYVSRILSKLDVSSRVEAATMAIKYKLIE